MGITVTYWRLNSFFRITLQPASFCRKLISVMGIHQHSVGSVPFIGTVLVPPQASGGVSLVRLDIVSTWIPLHTTLEAVTVRVRLASPLTICNLYLPPDRPPTSAALVALLQQLPPPHLILRDFNAHHPLWGSAWTSSRGRIIDEFLADHDLCLLNDGPPTHFSAAHGTFSAIDLSLISPSLSSLLHWSLHGDLCDSDHFPLIISTPSHSTRDRLPSWVFSRANWPLYTSHVVFPPSPS